MGSTVVEGPAVPPDQMSPRTRGPRTSCPPGHVVVRLDVPRQDGMSPTPFNAQLIVLRRESVRFEVEVERWECQRLNTITFATNRFSCFQAYLKPMKMEPMKLPCHEKGMKIS